MFEKILIREDLLCVPCKRVTIHIRVESRSSGKYGWCCEDCESVTMDNESRVPDFAAKKRGMW
jgi:hypothetical protein